MKISDFAYELIKVSEKAANLARIIRSEKALFDLLVEEKTGEAKNKRFVQDFKTLGDVLVQEVVTHDLGQKFPQLVNNIRGEESNTFTNTLGESVTVQIQTSLDETTFLLSKVLNGNQSAAELLAREAHNHVDIPKPPELTQLAGLEVDEETVGIWIDPIDSTAQYIEGHESKLANKGVYSVGLQCVVVLIGAFDLTTGNPFVGVVNQPFTSQDKHTHEWTGYYVWGAVVKDTNTFGSSKCLELPNSTSKSIVVSSSEDQAVQEKLSTDYEILHAAGAGYKILCVIDGLVTAYLLSKPSTFKWDTCAPHAILRSLGGGLIDMSKAKEMSISNGCDTVENLEQILSECQIRYNKPDSSSYSEGETWCNSGGLLAYQDPTLASDILTKI